MPAHKTIAAVTITGAAVVVIGGGLAFAAAEHVSNGLGMYFALTTGTTVGYGDITPRTPTGRYIAIMVMLTAVPLLAATFSILTSALTSSQVHRHMKGQEERIKAHVEERLRHHLGDDPPSS